jgi:hypothetical protein
VQPSALKAVRAQMYHLTVRSACLASDAVWKYNLLAHFKSVHPTATLEKYSSLAEISQLERTRLKQLFNAKPRASKKKVVTNIRISIAHSSQRALE